MADPLSIALGVAPLCVGAIKGVKAAKATLKTLRHSKSEIKTVKKRFTKETHVFLDECHLLLQEVIDPDDVVFMLEDTESKLWDSPHLDWKIKRHLGRRYDDFKEVVEDIKNNITALDKELGFIPGDQDNSTTSERIKGAIEITHHKSKWLSKIDNIKELNQDLKQLRKTAKHIQHAKTKPTASEEKKMPEFYRFVSQYSESFYQALAHCWSCYQSGHVHHDMAVFITQHRGPLNLVMRRRAVAGFKTITESIHLRVSSERITIADSNGPLAPCSNDTPEYCQDDLQPAKRIKLRNTDSSPSLSTFSTATTLPRSSFNNMLTPIDLSESGDVCQTICNTNLLVSTKDAPSCFLEDIPHLRHIVTANTSTDSALTYPEKDSIPIRNVLNQEVANSLSIPQQLELALALARGMLQFNVTPWWQTYWSLNDVYYFNVEGVPSLPRNLTTLHLVAEIRPIMTAEEEQRRCGKLIPKEVHDIHEAQLVYGIRNIALYCLGVALLQIDRWCTISADDVVAVRRLTQQTSRLGPRFQEVIRKCVECDFGQGADLEKPPLQNAVYSTVICEIENLVEVLRHG